VKKQFILLLLCRARLQIKKMLKHQDSKQTADLNKIFANFFIFLNCLLQTS